MVWTPCTPSSKKFHVNLLLPQLAVLSFHGSVFLVVMTATAEDCSLSLRPNTPVQHSVVLLVNLR